MMRKLIPVFLLLTLILAGCNLANLGGAQNAVVSTPTLAEIPTLVIEDSAFTPTAVEVLAPTNTPEPEPTAVTVEGGELEEPTEEPTAEPTVAPTATAALTGDPGVDNGAATWKEDFNNPAKAAFVQDEDWYSIGAVSNGVLVFTGKQSQVPAWRMAGTGDGKLGSVYMEAILQNGTCNVGADSAGLFFRVPNISNPNQGYLFGVNCEGAFYLNRWNGTTLPKGEMTSLIAATLSDAVNVGTDAINRVGVMTAADGRMIFYINGTPVAEFTSTTYPDGYFGVFVRPATASGFVVKVDQAAYWKSPKVPTDKYYTPDTSDDDAETGGGTAATTYNFSSFVEDPLQDPGTVLGAPTWRDYLNSSAYWGSFMTDYSLTAANQKGQLVMIGLQKEAGWVLAATPKLGDGVVEVVLENDKCAMWDSYGLFFRSPSATEGDRGYLFGVTCNGYYFLWRWDGKSDKMTSLVDYTKDVETINYGSGARNRLDVVLVGDAIQLYVNGTYLTSVYDSTWTEGYFGVFVRPQSTTEFTVKLDEASYWVNQTAQ